MKKILFIISFLILFYACKTDNKIEEIAISNSFKLKEIKINYPNDFEVLEINEKINQLNNKGVFSITEEVNRTKEKIFYDDLIIDTKNKKFERRKSYYEVLKDSLIQLKPIINSGYLEHFTINISSKNYTVYKLLEKGWDKKDCKVTIVSPSFGFIFSSNESEKYTSETITNDKELIKIINQIKKDSKWHNC